MIYRTTPLRTKQGNTIFVSEQTANYCKLNSITLSESNSSSTYNQRLQLLELLKSLPSLNTCEMRELGYLTPQPRILELRKKHLITTQRIDTFDRAGLLHKRVGLYTYVGELSNNGGEIA